MAPLAVGTTLSGLGGFLVIALGTRALGEAMFAPVSVLWSFWALSAAAISFPLQHWFIKSAATGDESSVWRALPRIALVVLAVALIAGTAALLLGERLYTTSPGAFATMTALLPVGSALVGLHRGVLAHRERFTAVAVSLAGENAIRVVVAAAVLVFADPSPGAAAALGWGVIGGFGIVAMSGGVVVPHRDATGAPSSDRRNSMSVASPSLRLLGGFAGANVSAQAVLTSAPVLLSLLGAPDATVTQVFVILALVRVPYTALVGASAGISGPLARMVDTGHGQRLRRYELVGVALAVVLAVIAAAIAPLVLPPVARILFATKITIGSLEQGLLASGGVIALASLLGMLILLARHRPGRLLGSWGAGVLVASAALTPPWTPVTRVSTAFLAAMLTAVAIMVMRREAFVSRQTRREGS